MRADHDDIEEESKGPSDHEIVSDSFGAASFKQILSDKNFQILASDNSAKSHDSIKKQSLKEDNLTELNIPSRH